MVSFLPTLEENNAIKAGNGIECLAYCIANHNKPRCVQYYAELRKKEPGIYTCPNGMSSYLHNDDDDIVIFTAFREKTSYNHAKAKKMQTKETTYNPVFSTEQMHTLVDACMSLRKREYELEKNENTVKDIMHETINLNAKIKANCELLFEIESEDIASTRTKETVFDKIKTIAACSHMISSRLSMYDHSSNPNALTMGKKISCDIFKTFDKMRHILKTEKHAIIISKNKKKYEHSY